MPTRHAITFSILLPLGVALLWFIPGSVQAQSPDGALLALINDARRAQGLYPYTLSTALTAAAQRHSDDMAVTGQISHTGSDGSSDVQRILEAGYGVYEFGPLVGENIYGGPGEADAPFNAWMEGSGARSNLLHEKYREIGIGVTSDAGGRLFWTVTLGAQPNVLPVLINDGASSVDTITVTLTLVPENAVPSGLGTAMGQPTAYRASTDSQFSGTEWQPWSDRVSFVLDETPGRQTVYVQLRDAADRTTVSQASVTVTGLQVAPTPTGTAATTTPGTPTATATPTPTLQPSPTTTATPTPTLQPSPTTTATPMPSPTASPSPVPSASPPTVTATATTPPAPTRAPRPTQTASVGAAITGDEPGPPSLTSRLVPWALGLQVVALALGVYIALRRPHEDTQDTGL